MWCESLFSLVNEVLKGLYHQIHSFIYSFIHLWFKGINYIKWLFLMLHWSFLKTKKCTWSLLVIFGISKNDHLLSTGRFLDFKKWPLGGQKECSHFDVTFWKRTLTSVTFCSVPFLLVKSQKWPEDKRLRHCPGLLKNDHKFNSFPNDLKSPDS